MFWLRNKKNNFQVHTLIWGPGPKEWTVLYRKGQFYKGIIEKSFYDHFPKFHGKINLGVATDCVTSKNMFVLLL